MRYKKVIITVVGLIGAIITLVIVFAQPSIPTLPQANNQLTNNPMATNTPVFSNTTATAESGTILSPTIQILTPTVSIGGLFHHPAIDSEQGTKLTLIRSSKSPSMVSLQDAMQSVQDTGVPWGLGGTYEGKPVTVTGIYGLVTFGMHLDYYNADGNTPTGVCATWAGPCNIPVAKCTNASCKKTGQVIEKIENRPMWIISYSNTSIAGSRNFTNNTASLVDEETGMVITSWGY